MIDRFYTGGYSDRTEYGVGRFAFDPEKGFTCEKRWKGFLNPSFLLPHPSLPVLYTVDETAPEGEIDVWALDGAEPRHIGRHASGGADPCHLSLSGDGRFLYAANYTGGSLAVFALDEKGTILRRCDLRQHAGRGIHPIRQEAAHVHFAMEVDGELLACDLGQDSIFRYRNERGLLRELGRIRLPDGSGPRHLAVSRKWPELLYCAAELDSRLYVIRKEGDTWQTAAAFSLLPAGFAGENTAAAIHFSPDGKLLLVSNRGHDSIAVFPLSADGLPGAPVLSPCTAQPRDFLPLGEYVIVGSQRDSLLQALRLDRETLRLTDTGWRAEMPRPVCLAAVPDNGNMK